MDKKNALSSELHTRLHLETGLMHHWYRNDKSAKEEFVLAQEASSFKFAVTGALGKRTKFQELSFSQLVIAAQSAQHDTSTTPQKNASVPQNLNLNDDTLLEKIEFSTNELDSSNSDFCSATAGNLSVIDQAILLAFW